MQTVGPKCSDPLLLLLDCGGSLLIALSAGSACPGNRDQSLLLGSYNTGQVCVQHQAMVGTPVPNDWQGSTAVGEVSTDPQVKLATGQRQALGNRGWRATSQEEAGPKDDACLGD